MRKLFVEAEQFVVSEFFNIEVVDEFFNIEVVDEFFNIEVLQKFGRSRTRRRQGITWL